MKKNNFAFLFAFVFIFLVFGSSNVFGAGLNSSNSSGFVATYNVSFQPSDYNSYGSIFVNLSNVNITIPTNLSNISITLYDSRLVPISRAHNSTIVQNANFSYNFTGLTNSLYYIKINATDGNGGNYASPFFTFTVVNSTCASATDDGLFDAVRIILILIGVFIIFGGSFALAKGYIDPSPEFIIMFVVGVLVYFACLPVARNLIVGFQC
jgi:hypothetical protein